MKETKSKRYYIIESWRGVLCSREPRHTGAYAATASDGSCAATLMRASALAARLHTLI